MALKKDIHQIIKEKFKTNRLSDERFSHSKYWDSAIASTGEPSESSRANPDILEEHLAPWSDEESDEKALRLEVLREVGNELKGREKEVYLLLLRYPYSGKKLASKLGISQQRVSAILQRISQKVYKKYGSKRSQLGL